ncbi:Albumin-2 [Cocos nucifera]|uniref:Albumin-2 n=1 Tax=Cocos nucifera TaxID=13894 RepID=A0A8K0MU35_COCNU|nr:Albumin-2 [Cocos nucifera]
MCYWTTLPGTTDDRVVNGPLLICDGYPSLTDTAFAEHGIDCAFGSHNGDEAFIFSANLCAQINYAPGTTDDKIIKGPMTIAAMFPFFKGTVFESGVDAAFESTRTYEAYLFKGNRYALINYGSDSHLIAIRLITQGFAGLKNTIFESGIEAAFASHRTDEAYLFKGDSYALINFAPGTTDDYIIGGVKKILPNWPSLRSILPRKNRGLDVHHHAKPDADRDHDEL